MNMNFKKLNQNAIQPSRGSQWAAGYDLYSCVDATINSNETLKIGTGIAVEIPQGYFGAVYARSGLATKHGLRLANSVAVIDADYRGELIVALHNDSSISQEIKAGDRIAQLVIQPYLDITFVETDELSDTARGQNGFGSTGTH